MLHTSFDRNIAKDAAARLTSHIANLVTQEKITHKDIANNPFGSDFPEESKKVISWIVQAPFMLENAYLTIKSGRTKSLRLRFYELMDIRLLGNTGGMSKFQEFNVYSSELSDTEKECYTILVDAGFFVNFQNLENKRI